MLMRNIYSIHNIGAKLLQTIINFTIASWILKQKWTFLRRTLVLRKYFIILEVQKASPETFQEESAYQPAELSDST